MIEIKCLCGQPIPQENIGYSNTANEIGEEYSIVTGFCDVCLADYEFSQWGHFDDEMEAIEFLHDEMTK